MKKLFLILAVLFSVTFSCIAEEFSSFLGIPFFTEKDEAVVEMLQKGWRTKGDYPAWFYGGNYNSGDIYYPFFGKKYAGKEIDRIMMYFINSEFCEVRILFENEEDAKDVFQAFIKKYGLIEVKGSDEVLQANYKTYELDPNDSFYVLEDYGFIFMCWNDTITIESLVRTDKSNGIDKKIDADI